MFARLSRLASGAEWLCLAAGVALRLSTLFNLNPDWGYDAPFHWRYVEWFAVQASLPPIDHSVETFHPPLYYALSGLLVRLGSGAGGVRALSVLFGCARLVVFLFALRAFVPGRLARSVALLLAGVVPASVFADGTLGAEALSNLEAALSLAWGAALLGGRRGLAVPLGLVLGLGLLTKISGLVPLGLFAGCALLGAVVAPGPGLRGRLLRLAPAAAAVALAAAVGFAWYWRNHQEKGVWVVSSFQSTQSGYLAPIASTPRWLRRTPDFFTGWAPTMHERPFWPSGTAPSRFWPLLLATTFSDYYCFGYMPRPDTARTPAFNCNGRDIPASELWPARLSFHGGLVIALVSALAWLLAVRRQAAQRDVPRLFLLLAPASGVLGLLLFAVDYPFDNLGVVKGAYLQYLMLPLAAVFGIACEWLLQRARPLGWLALGALGLVSYYSFYCRFG